MRNKPVVQKYTGEKTFRALVLRKNTNIAVEVDEVPEVDILRTVTVELDTKLYADLRQRSVSSKLLRFLSEHVTSVRHPVSDVHICVHGFIFEDRISRFGYNKILPRAYSLSQSAVVAPGVGVAAALTYTEGDSRQLNYNYMSKDLRIL
ncbi:hypothetical protein J6590_001702 [Homalodisca vitripennis]|nr:hypothetical protein J6590_001702 [Homalodisca vitripennis]